MVRASVLRKTGGELTVEDIDLPDPGPGQVRVRLAASGVCHSDLSLTDGTLRQRMPVVPGHEGAGTVVAAGPGVGHVASGDPVLLIWAPPCRECWFCERGEVHLCEHGSDAWAQPHAALRDGTAVYPGLGTASFAEETVVPARGVVRLPDDVELTDVALLGCAVMTGVGAVLNTADVRPGESVVIVGLGGIGLSAVQGARLAGADPIIAVDQAVGKAELASELGATHTLETGDDPAELTELPKRVRKLTGGRGADHAFECVGRAATIRLAWTLTRRGGRATVVGVGGNDERVAFSPLELFHYQRTLSTCMYGSCDPVRDVPLLIEHLRAGRLDLTALVTSRIGMDEVDSAFDAMQRGAGARHLVVF